ncbi:MAG: NAD(P)-dependent oxidoreductase [Alphaproteobacteria bacterium]
MTGKMPKIAFLGLGLMGRPMAQNLGQAGFRLSVWNRTRAKAQGIAGAEVAQSPAGAVENAEIVITMVQDGPAVEAVVFESGVADAAKPGTLFVDMSSIKPSEARDHAARLAQMGHAHVDAPVSGGQGGAQAGELAIMAGGEAADFAHLAPVFDALGRATYIGPHGTGQLAKLANQAIVGITIGAVAEALLLAKAGGADPAAVRAAITGGFADSTVLAIHGARMLARDFVPGGAAKNQLKDLNNVAEAAAESRIDLPLARLARDNFAALVDMVGSEYDHSALLLWLEAINQPHKLSSKPDKLP